MPCVFDAFGRAGRPGGEQDLRDRIRAGRSGTFVDGGPSGRSREVFEPRGIEVRSVPARDDFCLALYGRERLCERRGVRDIDEAGRKQLGDVLELREVVALQRVRNRNRRDGHAGGIACELQQPVLDGVGRQDHDRPLGRKPALDQRCGQCIDRLACVLISELAPFVAGAFLQERPPRLRLDRAAECAREARVVCTERHRAGEADGAVRVRRAARARRRERDRPMRSTGHGAGMIVHRAGFLWRLVDAL